jgi:amino acid transporter
MLIIANAYRRLNLWKANTGASFEWVGRAINPYLGVLTGWLMIAAYIVGTVADVLLLGIFTTRAAAEEFVRGDPFVLHGVVRNWTIREWNEALVPDK